MGEILLLGLQCHSHLVVVRVPNVYHDIVEIGLEVVNPMPRECLARQ